MSLPPIWVVYDHPKDFPGHYVARRWDGTTPTDDLIIEEKLEVLRWNLETRGLVKLFRNDDDDPHILESWI